jgi:hypothetical protein
MLDETLDEMKFGNIYFQALMPRSSHRHIAPGRAIGAMAQCHKVETYNFKGGKNVAVHCIASPRYNLYATMPECRGAARCRHGMPRRLIAAITESCYGITKKWHRKKVTPKNVFIIHVYFNGLRCNGYQSML